MTDETQELTSQPESFIQKFPEPFMESVFFVPALIVAVINGVQYATKNPWLEGLYGICVSAGYERSQCVSAILPNADVVARLLSTAIVPALVGPLVFLSLGFICVRRYYASIDGKDWVVDYSMASSLFGVAAIGCVALYTADVVVMYVQMNWLPEGAVPTCRAGLEMTMFHTCVEPLGLPWFVYLP